MRTRHGNSPGMGRRTGNRGLPGNDGAFTLVEMIVAISLILVVLTVFVQVAFIALDQQRSLQTRTLAHDQLQNVLQGVPSRIVRADFGIAENENPTLAQWTAIFRERFLPESVQETIARTVPDGVMRLETLPLETSTPETPPHETGFLLKAVLSWNDGTNRPEAKLTLVRLLTVVAENPVAPEDANVTEHTNEQTTQEDVL